MNKKNGEENIRRTVREAHKKQDNQKKEKK